MKFRLCFRLVSLMIGILLLGAGKEANAQVHPFDLHHDTILLNIRSLHSPLCQMVLKDVEIDDKRLYCRFLETRDCSSWGFDDSYFCVIDLESKEVEWQKCSYLYDYAGEFERSPQGMVHKNYDDSVVAKYRDGRWRYEPLDVFPAYMAHHTAPRMLYMDNQYKVDVLYLGEWGNFTWISYFPLKKSLLYPTALKNPVRIGDSLFLHDDAGIYFVEPKLISRARKGFCTAGECFEMEEYGILHHFYGNPQRSPRRQERRVKRMPKIVKTSFSDTVGVLYAWMSSADWFTPPDSLLLGLTTVDGKLYAVENKGGKQYLLEVDKEGMSLMVDLGPSSSQTRHKYAPGRVLLSGNRDRNESNITYIKGTEIRLITLLHEQDTLPWVEHDTFDSVLAFFHQHCEELNAENIDQMEKRFGFGSDRIGWDTLENKKLFRPYFLLMTNKLMVENVYWLAPQGSLQTVWWDFGKSHSSDDILDHLLNPQWDELKKEYLEQIPSRIARILGEPTRTEEDKIVWEMDEGTYTLHDLRGKSQLEFERK